MTIRELDDVTTDLAKKSRGFDSVRATERKNDTLVETFDATGKKLASATYPKIITYPKIALPNVYYPKRTESLDVREVIARLIPRVEALTADSELTV